jgi:hypothetical protein
MTDLHTYLDGAPWVPVVALAFLSGMMFERFRTEARREAWRRRKGKFGTFRKPRPQHPANRVVPVSSVDSFDPAAQLRHVELAEFVPRTLLNQSEARLFAVLERICAEENLDWRVMAQVSLGEILTSPSELAFRAINSKRVDLLLINMAGYPVHAIEYQGSGHHLGPAATRDAIKREALRKAGVGYVEIKPGDTPAEVRRLLLRLSGQN